MEKVPWAWVSLRSHAPSQDFLSYGNTVFQPILFPYIPQALIIYRESLIPFQSFADHLGKTSHPFKVSHFHTFQLLLTKKVSITHIDSVTPHSFAMKQPNITCNILRIQQRLTYSFKYHILTYQKRNWYAIVFEMQNRTYNMSQALHITAPVAWILWICNVYLPLLHTTHTPKQHPFLDFFFGGGGEELVISFSLHLKTVLVIQLCFPSFKYVTGMAWKKRLMTFVENVGVWQ